MILEHLPVLPVLVFFLAALLVPLVAPLGSNLPWLIAVVASVAASALGVLALFAVQGVEAVRYAVGGWKPPIGIELVLDPLSAFVITVLGLVSAVVLVHSRDPVARELPRRAMPFYAATMLLLGGFSGMVLTGDLFNLYVFLEISALAGYALLGAGTPRAAVATFRYLLLGTLGASLYLIGLGFLLIETGSLNMADVAAILGVTGLAPLSTLALIFMVVGMGIKMALLPLHQWLPDVYAAAPASSSALVAPIGTKVAAYVLIRLLYDVFPAGPVLVHLRALDLVAWFGAAGILWGSFMAIPQRDLKRMLAYSSVAQIGYIALGIGLGTAYGLIGAVLHILNHACMKACLFLVSANLEQRGRGIDITRFDASLRRDLPATSAAFVLSALSMIGLPPTAGFFSKWYLLLGSWSEGRWVFIGVIVLSSLLNAVYFFRIIERMYLGKADAEVRPEAPANGRAVLLTAPVVGLALALLVLGLGNVFIVTRLIEPMLPPVF